MRVLHMTATETPTSCRSLTSLRNPRFYNSNSTEEEKQTKEMAFKLAVVVLAVLVVLSDVSASENGGIDELSNYWNQFKEQMKPITSQFPSPPSSGFGSFPGIPGLGGSSGSASGNSKYKRQINPNTMSEWFSQFQEAGNNLSGNLPFKPPSSFGQFPFPGSSSGSSETSGNQNS